MGGRDCRLLDVPRSGFRAWRHQAGVGTAVRRQLAAYVRRVFRPCEVPVRVGGWPRCARVCAGGGVRWGNVAESFFAAPKNETYHWQPSTSALGYPTPAETHQLADRGTHGIINNLNLSKIHDTARRSPGLQ
jgi:hypothetical protein